MQRPAGLLGAATAIVVLFFAACGGKVVVDGASANGEGGAGGSSGSTVDGPFSAVAVSSVVSVGVTTVSVGGGSVTTGSGMSCSSCEHAVTGSGKGPMLNPMNLCPDAQALFDTLIACACTGPCATQCGANLCVGESQSPVCGSCIGAGGPDTCGDELVACVND